MKRSITSVLVVVAAAGLALGACSDSKSGSGGDFCTLARAYNASQASTDAIFNGDTKPADVQKAFDTVSQQIAAMVNAAPAEIKADAVTLQKGLKTFDDTLKKVNYDFTKLSTDPAALAALQELNSDEFNLASQHLDAYLSGTCGIALGS
jgi:hypothetical protein